MTLYQQSIQIGNWLFCRRGWLPTFVYLLATLAILGSSQDHLYHWSFGEELLFLCLSLIGLIIRSLTIGYAPENTSGRNTKEGQIAASLNTLGMYSMVRHPLYVGNFFMWLGLILYVGVDWFIPIVILMYWWYYEKIVMAEEDFLTRKFGEPYARWCERTNTFFPNFKQWQSPPIPFCFRNILKREYHGIFYLMLSFVFLNVLRNFALGQTEIVDRFWLYCLIITTLACVLTRILVKRTSLLHRQGR